MFSQEKWITQLNETQASLAAKDLKIQDLEEQLQDLCLFLDTKDRLEKVITTAPQNEQDAIIEGRLEIVSKPLNK